MMSRQVTAFVEPDSLSEVIGYLTDEVLPAYRDLPHFLGFTVLQSELGPRTEVVATTYWDDGLEETAQLSEQLVATIRTIKGVTASRRSFEILYATMRDTAGGFSAEHVPDGMPD